MTDLFTERTAVLSDCGRYRYRLGRRWDPARGRVLYVMLNPSTADADTDDPTIRSCTRLARGLGYGGFEVVNLFAFRATDPDELLREGNPVGPENERHHAEALKDTRATICAWGAHAAARGRTSFLLQFLRDRGGATWCFGVTKGGAPRHPLYVKSGTPLVRYEGFT